MGQSVSESLQNVVTLNFYSFMFIQMNGMVHPIDALYTLHTQIQYNASRWLDYIMESNITNPPIPMVPIHHHASVDHISHLDQAIVVAPVLYSILAYD